MTVNLDPDKSIREWRLNPRFLRSTVIRCRIKNLIRWRRWSAWHSSCRAKRVLRFYRRCIWIWHNRLPVNSLRCYHKIKKWQLHHSLLFCFFKVNFYSFLFFFLFFLGSFRVNACIVTRLSLLLSVDNKTVVRYYFAIKIKHNLETTWILYHLLIVG